MKTATVRDSRSHYAKLMEWIAAGEEIIITQRGKSIARLTPERGAGSAKVNWADSPEVRRDRRKETKLTGDETYGQGVRRTHRGGGRKMVICGETSFLFSLYGNDANSPRAVRWAAKGTVPITLSQYNPFELGNALRFAEFRGVIRHGEAAMAWAQFEAAVQAGRLLKLPCNLADVLDEATRLSATHTLAGGHRGFDILHVAAALVLGGAEAVILAVSLHAACRAGIAR